MVVYTLILVLRRQRSLGLCKLEVSLVYIPSSRTARIEPVSKQKAKRKKKKDIRYLKGRCGGSKTSLPKGPRAG